MPSGIFRTEQRYIPDRPTVAKRVDPDSGSKASALAYGPRMIKEGASIPPRPRPRNTQLFRFARLTNAVVVTLSGTTHAVKSLTYFPRKEFQMGFLGRNHQTKTKKKTNMRTANIEFNPPTTVPLASVSPWLPPAKRYQDLILRPEFASRKHTFPAAATWFRVVPALPGSQRDWMIGINALQHPGGRHCHCNSIIQGGKSVFDIAFGWLKENRKDALYSKANKEGCRLLSDPYYLCWILVEEEGKLVARLLLANGYDGSRGGAAGLGHQILQLTKEVDEDGNPLGDPADPSTGAQICVEKRQVAGSRYPSYRLRMGRVAAPYEEMVARMAPEEVAALTPLEQVIHLPSEEEEWQLLQNVIDLETIKMIRNAIE